MGEIRDGELDYIVVGAGRDMLMAQTSLTRDLGPERYGYEPVPLTAPYGWLGEDGETLLRVRRVPPGRLRRARPESGASRPAGSGALAPESGASPPATAGAPSAVSGAS
jgi:hypothetical protein